MSDALLARFAEVGRDLFLTGAVTTHGGNLSVRDGDRIFISRRGSMLGRMRDGDVIETSIEPCAADEHCSRELVVHRAIYQATDAKAIVHAHTVHTIYRSFVADEIRPIDSESRYVIGLSVPVFAPAETIASPEAAEMLSEALGHLSVAVLRSHGPFAIGESLEEAFYRISALEASCQILDLRDTTGLPQR
jgi:L-fuculose-phosphate aldolase